MSDAEKVAERIRNSDTWDDPDARELCRLAGLEQEYKDADGDTFERVIYQAAEILHVEI